MMKKYNFSDSLQKIIEYAQSAASGNGVILPVHLLKSLLISKTDKVEYWFKIHNIDAAAIEKNTDDVMKSLPASDTEVSVAESTREVLRLSGIIAIQSQEEEVRPLHLLMAILDEPDEAVEDVFSRAGVDLSALEDIIYIEEMKRSYVENKSVMMKYGVNLNLVIEKNGYVPVTAGWKIIDELMEIMCRTYKNIPLIVGGQGVEKSLFAEGLAYRILKGGEDSALQGNYVIHMMTDSLIADSDDINGFVSGLREVLDEAEQYNNIILYFDELYPEYYGSGAIDLPMLLKPFLKRGRVRIIGSSERSGLSLMVDKDNYIRSRIDLVKLQGFSGEKIIGVLERFAERIKTEHDLKISGSAVRHAYHRVSQFLGQNEPIEETLDVLDMSATRRSLNAKGAGPTALRSSDIDEIVSELAGVPVWRIRGDFSEYAAIEKRLASEVAGQRESIAQIAEVVRSKGNRFNLDPGLPNGIFLFVGPRGVGKKQMVTALADVLYDDGRRVSYLDMGNFTEPESIWELLGYNDPAKGGSFPSILTEKIQRYPHSILFLEEIDKAAHEVRELFTEIFKTGSFTDSHGNTVSFKGITVIMTVKAYEDKKKQMGFVPRSGYDFDRIAVNEAMSGILKQDLTATIDSIVIFNELRKKDIAEILRANLMSALTAKMDIDWVVDDSLIEHLVSKVQESDDKLRSMQSIFRKHVFYFLAGQYYSAGIAEKKKISLGYAEGKMVIS